MGIYDSLACNLFRSLATIAHDRLKKSRNSERKQLGTEESHQSVPLGNFLRILVCILPSLAYGQDCTLMIAAASDLAPLRQKLIEGFNRSMPCKITVTFASSGQLASQIEQGAPFDLYLSASEDYVGKLSASGKIEASSVIVFARGRLGLWAPGKTNAVRIKDLAQPSFKNVAIANPAHAPYGLAAKQALTAAGLWDGLKPRIVLGENVRQALQFAETGNADAVITAWSLLREKPGATILDVAMHKEIRQTLGIVNSTANKGIARKFANWLSTAEGKKILADAGFY